ncbi:MAG: CRTAC1 family protein [Planctomycetota bacterium]|jgi:hypothetical protein|nr:CRTAC1 family protein [Planctomycetota bacterium]MDP6763749.1 CRTAC1 family protein [Planctomycetota bacterium]MDP6989225.1 CRTAC1 family protein [Planctomycetota bacterium]
MACSLSTSFGLLAAVLAQEPLFEDVSARWLPGVRTVCGAGEEPAAILEVNGGGLVVEDFDGDGRLDLVVVDGSTVARVEADEPGLPPRLFLGVEGGGFAPSGEPWAMAGGRWGMGGCAGDVNGDGWPDLVVTEWGADRLFLNEAGGGFVEATEDAGLRGEGWGTSAALGDLDGDGHLDLVVVNYLDFDIARSPRRESGCVWKGHAVVCGPEGLAASPDQLYRGRGDGTFEEVSLAWGFAPPRAGFGLGVVTLDYDLDGDLDLYVSNDSTPNHLWENRGEAGLVEVAFRRGVGHDANGKEQAGMGIACGDVNADLRPDLVVTNFSGEHNAFYRSSAGVGFRERSHPAGLAGPSQPLLGWGTGLFDFDHDGDLDLFVLNGHVYPEADRPGTDTTYAQPDLLFRGTGGSFAPEPLWAGEPAVSRAGVAADLDGDGDLDLASIERGGRVRVLRNRLGGEDHWLGVRLRGAGPNTFAIGARVTAACGERRFTAEARTGAGFQAGGPAQVHLGLGPAERVDRLEIRWPSGQVTTLEGVRADRWLTVEEEAL